jgi:hypothetical protein
LFDPETGKVPGTLNMVFVKSTQKSVLLPESAEICIFLLSIDKPGFIN